MKKFLAVGGLLAGAGVAVVAYLVFAATIICPGNGVCNGTNGPDTIIQNINTTTAVNALGGNDVIQILADFNTAGNIINGDTGSDTFLGQAVLTKAVVFGGSGNDFFRLDNAVAIADTGRYFGGDGSDSFRSNTTGSQDLNGGLGNDFADFTNATGDVSFGDANNDAACTGADNAPEGGSDVVLDGVGRNIICTGDGNDRVTLQADGVTEGDWNSDGDNTDTGEDPPNLGPGNDVLLIHSGSSGGTENLICGPGFDTVIFTPAADFGQAPGTVVTPFPGGGVAETATGHTYTNKAGDCERVIFQ